MSSVPNEPVVIKNATPWVKPRARASDGTGEITIDAVLDTGCAISLVIPPALDGQVQTSVAVSGHITLADGSAAQCTFCRGEVHWLGQWRPNTEIRVMRSGSEALLGMPLLKHTRIGLAEDRGYVEAVSSP